MTNVVQIKQQEEKCLAELAAKVASDSTQIAGIEALLRAEPVDHCMIWR